MYLYVDSYGSYLGLRDGLFWTKPKTGQGRAFAPRNLKAIFLTKGVRLSTDALILALEQEIPVLLLDALGRPLGQVWSGYYGTTPELRRKQLLFMSQPQALYWGREILQTKIEQQINLLENNQTPNNQALLAMPLALLAKMLNQFKEWTLIRGSSISEVTASFRGWEGTASRYYFQGISSLLSPVWQFQTRNKRPALDPFNALLNYLYGILYGLTELNLMKIGLDPYVGVLHVDGHRRRSLVFDCIELYRQWAEMAALHLCRSALLDPQTDFDLPSPREGLMLSQVGKAKVVPYFLAFLDERVPKPDASGHYKRLARMEYDFRQFAQFLNQIPL